MMSLTLVKVGSDNDLLPDGINPLSGPMTNEMVLFIQENAFENVYTVSTIL